MPKLPRLLFHFLFALGLAGCASKLVDLGDLDEAPKEYSQSIKELDVEIAEKPAIEAEPKAKPSVSVTEADKKKAPKATLPAPAKQVTPPKPKAGTWQPTGWPYGIGEVAEYSLRYGLIEGGIITMSIKSPKEIEGEKVLHYSANVRSSRLLELFYKVDNTIDSWVTIGSHLPVRQEIQQRESEQWGNRVVAFNTKAQTAKFYANTERRKKKRKIERFNSKLDHFAQDIFSAIYFFRFIEPRERVNFSIHDRGKNWNNETVYLGTETLDLPVGRTKARRYKLRPRVSGHLEPKGDVEAWFSDDERRIMVRFRATLKFGSITGDLRSYQAGNRITMSPPLMVTPTNLDKLGNTVKK
jgi:hypothetical protein